MFTTLNLRVVLWSVLAAVLLMNYTAWVRDYPPAAPADVAAGNPAGTGALGDSAPTVAAAGAAGGATAPAAHAPALDAPTGAGGMAAATGASLLPPATSGDAAPLVHVHTDVLDVDVSLEGGELARADLPLYPLVKDQATPVRLLNRDSPDSLFVLQSGLAAAAGTASPTHLTRLNASVSELHLNAGQDELRLPLTWTDGHGVTVTKTYVFHRGRYGIDLEYQVQNASAAPWEFAPYSQLLRNNQVVETSYFHPESYAYKGPAYDDGQKYQKLKLEKEPPKLDQQVNGGWIGALQHHFVAAIVPPAGAPWHYQLTTRGTEYLLAATGPTQAVAPGGSVTLHESLFVGPKLQSQLDQVSPRLYLVTDYGKLSFLARPLFWLLDKVHSVFGNWGWTIVFATLLLKLAFYPLSEASMRSMARMKALQPRIKQLQETYKDERDKLGKAMMELYQREKVNPVAGCLPMLIQFPVFIAFYWVLLESVEMRQAPFFAWITDLSARDPFFILPAIMAGANYVNFRLNPQMGDPTQQKVFMVMQIAMPVMFAFFPSGLVLYWVTNTLLSILQQWNINRRILGKAGAAR